ncbi:MAG: hypothetical protein OXE99_00800, partial [Cellvibrionales bacterium]|nr:hypothetical protein [Cellvibrionales bacterium]
RMFFAHPIVITEQSQQHTILFDASRAFPFVSKTDGNMFGVFRPEFLLKKDSAADVISSQYVMHVMALLASKKHGVVYLPGSNQLMLDRRKGKRSALDSQIESPNVLPAEGDIQLIDFSEAECDLLLLEYRQSAKRLQLPDKDCQMCLSRFLATDVGQVNQVKIKGKIENGEVAAKEIRFVLLSPRFHDPLIYPGVHEINVGARQIASHHQFMANESSDVNAAACSRRFAQALAIQPHDSTEISMQFANDEKANTLQTSGQAATELKLSFAKEEGRAMKTKSGYQVYAERVGKEITDFLLNEVNSETFNDHHHLMALLHHSLISKKAIEPSESLFNALIRPQTNLDEALRNNPKSALARGFNEKHSEKFDQRNHLAAIVALQWYMETLKPKEAQNQRGATTISGFENLFKFYLKYISEVNRRHGLSMPIDYRQSSATIYRMMAKIRSATHPIGSTKAYLRDGFSSHLKQAGLIDPHQIGIDMRLSSDTNPLEVLPTKARHLLLGFYEMPSGKLTQVFYKMEGHGLSKVSDFFLHMKKWVEHSQSGKAGMGFRETRLDTEAVRMLIEESDKRLMTKGWNLSESFKNEFLSLGANTLTVGYFIQIINHELKKLHIHDTSFIEEIFGVEAESRIGSEIKLTPTSFLVGSASGWQVLTNLIKLINKGSVLTGR